MKLTFVLLAAVAAAFAQGTSAGTGTECEPHGDHWHCPDGVAEPTTPPATEDHHHEATATASCEPHGDHWHCPDGVSEPTTPPAPSVTTPATSGTPTSPEHNHETTPAPSSAPASEDHGNEATATTCEPHGDHWHCPSGVAEPTTLPASESSPTPSTTQGNATTAAPSQFTGAAVVGAKRGSLGAMVLGAIGVFVV